MSQARIDRRKGRDRAVRGAGAALAGLLSLFAATAGAQVQRTLVNLSFEQPSLGAGTCFRTISETVVPGWFTDHPVIATQTVNCDNANIPGAPATGAAMEFWANNFNGTPARSGAQLVELNASAVSRLSQTVCLVNGEQVNWVFSHRGRGSDTVQDVMEYLVGAVPIVRVGTTSNGSGGVLIATLGSSASVLGPNGWRDYSGVFTYTGATGQTNLGFQAISTASGSATVGNFLDQIQIQLRPFVEFVQASNTKAESTAANNVNIPRLRVSGTVPAGGMTVAVTITGGTATLGVDYTTPGNSTALSVNVPAGTYDGLNAASQFPLPVTLVIDALAEPSETITFSLPASALVPPPYLRASTTSCGASATVANVLTITDDVARFTLSKTVASRPVAGTSGFAISLLQNSATVASASTGVGSGASNTSATTGQQLVTAGTPVTLTEVLQAGSTQAFNQFNAAVSCSNATAGSPTVLPSGIDTNGTWTVTPAVNDQITCIITNTARPATVALTKSVASRANAADQFRVSVVQAPATVVGSAVTAGAGTSASSGTLTLPDLTSSYSITDAMEPGSVSMINQYTATITCSNARPGAAASFPVSGSAPTWGIAPAAGDIVSCTVTNTRAAASLVLAKQLAGARINAADQFQMAITGPSGTTATTSGAGATVTGGTATVAAATPGSAYTLVETMAAGSVSPLTSYQGSISCSNSRPGAVTLLPSGAGTSFALTPLAGDNISCTLTNTPGQPALTVTKTNGSATYRPGTTSTYTIVVGNTGTGAANGATVLDNLPAGMTLSAPWTCVASAGSTCPASGGTAGGVVVSLSVSVSPAGTVTITVPVQLSANPANY